MQPDVLSSGSDREPRHWRIPRPSRLLQRLLASVLVFAVGLSVAIIRLTGPSGFDGAHHRLSAASLAAPTALAPIHAEGTGSAYINPSGCAALADATAPFLSPNGGDGLPGRTFAYGSGAVDEVVNLNVVRVSAVVQPLRDVAMSCHHTVVESAHGPISSTVTVADPGPLDWRDAFAYREQDTGPEGSPSTYTAILPANHSVLLIQAQSYGGALRADVVSSQILPLVAAARSHATTDGVRADPGGPAPPPALFAAPPGLIETPGDSLYGVHRETGLTTFSDVWVGGNESVEVVVLAYQNEAQAQQSLADTRARPIPGPFTVPGVPGAIGNEIAEVSFTDSVLFTTGRYECSIYANNAAGSAKARAIAVAQSEYAALQRVTS
jgi:hypothetical protein